MLTKEQARGATLGYFILYKKTDSGSKENQTVLGKEITSFLLTSLKEYTPYQFSMQAFNSKGVSNESAPLERRTDEDSKWPYTSINTVQSAIPDKMMIILLLLIACKIIAEPVRLARTSGTPLLSKFGNLSSQEVLVVT